ncbi:conserved hypothetical protein [Thermodesulfovibrio yellowstonii DSM 11347]|uniref:Uncharacterized protein n=1 Tax=Thermodesulfovibrio yellowstonii (strain ATCC 51303 / DSM 11347 / YP87) TaxID=289376 RepID=B5YL13_THEYD|nr:conserved hypothetical protein [Thermodesulfovibrio yellowstonii DSM 11347]
MFQFLIGRLKTKLEGTELLSEYKFQFLIGRLKTEELVGNINLAKQVSIPHR